MTPGRREHSAIYTGTVMHRRHLPRGHRFTYGVYYLWLDLDELERLDRDVRGFGVDRPAPVSFHRSDHGPRDGRPLRPWFDEQLASAGIDLEGGAVRLLTLPRILGYVFNPISVWCGYGPGGDLRAVLYEVSNTFGGTHSYLFPAGELDPAGNARHVFDKELFVSPFIDMDALYEFRMRPPDDRAALLVREFTGGERVLTATFVAERSPLTTRSLGRAFLTHPLVTLKVIAGIHLQALKLLAKRAPFRRHLPPPPHPVTIAGMGTAPLVEQEPAR